MLLRFLCAFQAEMYAKILGPVYLRTIRFYSSSKWADLPYKICLSTMQFYSSFKALFRFRTKSCLFEYHVILLFFQSSIGRSLSTGLLENHAILPFSKAGITMKKFENHVILTSSKPNSGGFQQLLMFEYHVILSSSKPVHS